jgi:hypothetical protein
MRVGSSEWRWYQRNRLRLIGREPQSTGHAIRDLVVRDALELVGIREQPPGSNSGPAVHQIQSSTGAYGLPWCVSTVQRIWQKAGIGTWANRTAGAYQLADYARAHNATVPHPIAGASVVYRLGDGHAGTIVKVYRDGTFDAVEGNYSDSVARVHRDPRTIGCTFILRPELR